jgi:hypothetical protein
MSEEQVAAPTMARLRWVHVGLAGVVVVAAVGLTVAATRDAAAAAPTVVGCGSSTPRLTVQGTGQASGTPDSLDFDAQVSVTAGSAASALAQDSATTSSVVQAIEAAGVKAADVQTADLTINPNYTYPDGRTVISGYAVSNSLSVTVTKLATAGSVIDAATTAGGDALSVGFLNFTRADPRTLEDQARRDAVRQAVTHAGAMARAAGQRLAGVCSITDRSGLDQGPIAAASDGALFQGAANVPLEGGTEQASAQVTLVYELGPLRG